jgi:hypothetical protein
VYRIGGFLGKRWEEWKKDHAIVTRENYEIDLIHGTIVQNQYVLLQRNLLQLA